MRLPEYTMSRVGINNMVSFRVQLAAHLDQYKNKRNFGDNVSSLKLIIVLIPSQQNQPKWLLK